MFVRVPERLWLPKRGEQSVVDGTGWVEVLVGMTQSVKAASRE